MTIASPSRLAAVVAPMRWLLAPCAVGLALPMVDRLLPSTANALSWLLDLAAHWQWLYASSWLALCLLCTARTLRWLLLAPLALLPMFSASKPLPQADGEKPALVVIAANVHVGNRDPMPLVAWLRAQPADVIVISELSGSYAEALSHALGADYRYRELRPKNSPFGIGIVSRLPLRNIMLIDDADGVQTLSAEVSIGRQSVRIVAAHPMPPLSPEWHSKRNHLLSMLARQANHFPTIVSGDLNATPWSTAIIDAEDGGLLRTTSLTPTWPSWGRGVFGIPIDHVLASAHWRRGESSRGPDIGSDHYPVRVTLHWADDRDVE
jgi:endonuclease/exonuclease/phosphatase (EEP) superfamily protein YafD